MQQPIPAGTAFYKAPVVAYHSANDFLGNFGHVLFDYLFPVFNMLQLLGLYTPEVQIVFAQQQVSSRLLARGQWIPGTCAVQLPAPHVQHAAAAGPLHALSAGHVRPAAGEPISASMPHGRTQLWQA